MSRTLLSSKQQLQMREEKRKTETIALRFYEIKIGHHLFNETISL